MWFFEDKELFIKKVERTNDDKIRIHLENQKGPFSPSMSIYLDEREFIRILDAVRREFPQWLKEEVKAHD